MIVRDSTDAWLLISQVDHAAVAAEIAAVWQLPASLAPLAGEFQFAVAHHDDGWQEWEQTPTIDADGHPRDFMEMPMPVSTHLWSHSVNIAARRSPWCGLWVSRHFCHLAELAVEHREETDDRTAARRFLTDQVRLQQRWRVSAGSDAARNGDSAVETAGLRGLQFFDRLSLWLCCADRTEPLEIDDPDGSRTRWQPAGQNTILVAAANLSVPQLAPSAPTIAVPRTAFASDAELHEAIARGKRQTLRWMLSRQNSAD